MSSTTDFIAELVRAANEVEKLGGKEIRRLLDRSVAVILEMREKIGIPPSKTTSNAVIDLQATEFPLMRGAATVEEVRAALLDAAGMIRDLHIVLDTGTEIEVRRE